MWKKLPKNFVNKSNFTNKNNKAVLDQYDMEAIAEGTAIYCMNKNKSKEIIGRRFTKMRNLESRGISSIRNKRVKNFTKDHIAALEKYMEK